MKTLPSKITHIASNAVFKPLSIKFGRDIKAKCIKKGDMLIRKGGIIEIDIATINHKEMLWVTPIGENF